MFIISECNEYAVAISAIAAFRIYDADADYNLYANMASGYMTDGEHYLNGYPIFSSEDKQKCIAIRDKLIEQIKDRTRTAIIRIADISSQLS